MNQLTSADGHLIPLASVADWEARRSRALAGMAAVMGNLPLKRRCPLDVRVESERDCGSFRIRSLTYASEPGCRTPAFLLVPCGHSAETPRSGILCLHSRNHRMGHRSVVDPDAEVPQGLACRLATRGHVVLAPCYPNMGEYAAIPAELGYPSASMKAVWDNIRGLDLLGAMPEVRVGCFAAIGHSMGGYNGLFTAVFDQRIRAVASNCGFDALVDYRGGDLSVWGDPWHMPRILTYPKGSVPFDFHDVLALIAPRPCFVSAPLHDPNFIAASARRVVQAAAAVYELHGRRDRLICEQPDCEHVFTGASEWSAVTFLEQALRNER